MSEHTPTPWRLAYPSGKRIMTGDGAYLLAEATHWGGIHESGANAAFIVLAVNNHELLLAAAKAALPYVNGSDNADAAWKQLRDTIALAEGTEA